MMQCFFGDRSTAFNKEQFYGVKSSQDLLHHEPFKNVSVLHTARALIAPHQTHSSKGLLIETLEQACAYQPYACEADFSVTNVPGVALMVATADCVPLILYDAEQQVVACVHAGWQGTVAGIAQNAAYCMHQKFGAEYSSIQAIFGPCARVDAYEVGPDFVHHLAHTETSLCNDVLVQNNGRYYFDMPLYNQRLLEQLGVTNFKFDCNYCTITDMRYCSYRRERESARRQMSIVMLD